MKWMIASDIHGSAYYCGRMIEAYKNENAERLLLLGDILYHGPRNDLPKDYAPKKVIAMLNNMKNEILCVRGNCDTEVDQMVLEFPILADYAVITGGKRDIYATHGHIYNEKNLPPMRDGDIVLCGHTHVPKCSIFTVMNGDGRECTYTYINPGSISIPKEDSWHGYITMEDCDLKWKDLDGNIKDDFRL